MIRKPERILNVRKFFCAFCFFLALGCISVGIFSLLYFHSLSSPKKIPEITQIATSSSNPINTLQGGTFQGEEEVIVKRVIDGDTIELTDGRRVRYIGIDTPELVHPQKPVECFASDAKAENQKLVEGKSVRLVKDISETDTYGRLLRYVFVGDVFVNDYLVRQGFAHATSYPPDVLYQDQFLQAEKEAQEAKRGFWTRCQ